MFQVGQEVVCVDTHGNDGEGPYSKAASDHLQPGNVYKISGFREAFGVLFVSLHGIKGLWYHKRFKPVEKKTTDISIFTAMLKTEKAKV